MGLALMAGTALAQPKGKKGGTAPKPAAGSADNGGEIEMGDKPDSGGKGGNAGGSGSGGGSGSDAGGEIDMGDQGSGNQQGDLNADLNAAQTTQAVKVDGVKKTPLSWKDIVVVIRKPFLKTHRTELQPFVGTTMNDNMIRHYSIGGELAYWLTDALAVGVEGQYYTHATREPFDLVARQARRLPTVNQYNWSAALDFHYVPVYGKFALLDRKLVTWEAYFTAGIGAGQSEVIPRDTKYPGFTNLLIMPNIGINMRFFLAKWLTVNIGIRDYIFYDHFEPTDRSDTMYPTASEAKDHADGALINNVMFQIGVAFWVPTKFEYTTFR
ncbi:MAG TPA: outer membrane beta-barrel domain-containing protein [Kofleriaceae bacterium]